MRWILLLLISPLSVQSQTCSDMRVAYQNSGCCDGNDCTMSIPHCDNTDPGKVCYDGTEIIVKGLLDALGFDTDQLTLKKHLIPIRDDAECNGLGCTSAAWFIDIGNAEYKIRDVFEDPP